MDTLNSVVKGLSSVLFLSVLICLVSISLPREARCFDIIYNADVKDFTGAVIEIAQYKDSVYLGTLDRGIVVFDPASGRVEKFGKNGDLPSPRVESIAGLEGSLYIGTEDGLAIYDGSEIHVVKSVGNITMRKTYVGVDSPSSIVYAASLYLAGGLVRNDGSGWKFIGGEGRGLFNDINSFAFHEGRVFFGSIRGTLFTFDGKTIEKATEEFFPSNIFSLTVMNGKVYVGTGRGLYEVDGKKWLQIQLGKELDSSAIFDMHRGDDFLLLATTDGIARYREGKTDVITMKDGLPAKRVNAVYEHGGVVYAGTPVGLVLIKRW